MMTCKRSFTTKTGKFTFFHEESTRCHAEKKCRNRGEILAPITNRRDAKKFKELLMSNNKVDGCPIKRHSTIDYWIGLDVTYTEYERKKVFSNGVAWKERKHSKIYQDYNNQYTDCAIAHYHPVLEKFAIGYESLSCKWQTLKHYVCLKPANTNATAESIVQDEDSFDDEYLALTSGVMFAMAAVVVFVFAIGTVVGAHIQKRKEAKGKVNSSEVCIKKECI